jgi:hypothetical protein
VQSAIPCIFSQHHKTGHNETNEREGFTEHPFSIPHIKPYSDIYEPQSTDSLAYLIKEIKLLMTQDIKIL